MITPSFALTATERVLPKLALDFTTASLDPRVTFTRSGAVATRVNASGLIENVPANTARFDYDPVTLAPKGLLVEESRTNLALNSAVITAGAGTTVSPDAAVSPDGTLSADLIIETVITGEHYAGDRAIAVTAGSTYTWSAFVKDAPSANRSLYLRVAGGANITLVFDPRTKTISNPGGPGYLSSAFQELPNGWFRVTMAFTAQTTATLVCRLQLFTTTSVYTGDGTSGLYLWGAQLEAGSFPSSYIPTVASQVTRSADVATITGTNFSSWYNASEGTFVAWASIPSNYTSGFYTFFEASDGTTANRISNVSNAGADVINIEMTTASSLVAGFYPSYASGNTKLAFTYKLNNTNYGKDGVAGTTDTTSAVPTLSQVNFGANQIPSNFLNGHVQKFFYYPQRLINAELAAFSK